ncbi:MAG: SDR family NAD(P)-dependent oxidoreductase, partial [Mycobacterium sp.]
MSGRLAGEVAVVTGSTSGLGREIARLFATEQGRVIVTGRNAERGTAVVDAIARTGGIAQFVAADLTNDDEREGLVEATVERFGALTVLVNNAVAKTSGPGSGKVTEISPEAFEEVLAVNLVAPAAMSRLAIPPMLASGHGSIVNISSRAAELGTPGTAAYTASKGGLNALA